MNILDTIKQYFPNPLLSHATDREETKLINSVVLSSNTEIDNEPNVKIRIEDTSTDACRKFAEMLYELNTGSYHETIIRLMVQMSDQDDEIKKFMETAILYWGFLLNNKKLNMNNNEEYIDKPLIMPTDFNKNAK